MFGKSLDPDQAKSSGLIWIQTVWHSDGILEIISRKKKMILKKSADDKKQQQKKTHEKLPRWQRVKRFTTIGWRGFTCIWNSWFNDYFVFINCINCNVVSKISLLSGLWFVLFKIFDVTSTTKRLIIMPSHSCATEFHSKHNFCVWHKYELMWCFLRVQSLHLAEITQFLLDYLH